MVKSISEITHLWNKTLKIIEKNLGEKQLFETFFSDTYIYDIEGNKIIVAVESPLAVQLMKQRYIDIISSAVNEVTNENYEFEFVLEKDLFDKTKQESKSSIEVKKAQYFADAVIKEDLTFNNFVIGKFNQEASKAALVVSNNPGKVFNPLFIYSHSGLGKTHLMNAIGNQIMKVSKVGSKVLYITAADFVEEYIKFTKGEKEAETLKDFICGYDVLLIDDIQMLSNKFKSQEMFFTIYEKMSNTGKQIVLTSDRQPNEIKDIEDRLVTRFNKGLLVNIGEPDIDTCVQILKMKITGYNIDVNRFDNAVLYCVAEKFCKDVRELEGALNRLIFYCINMKQCEVVTMEDALEALQSIIPSKSLNSNLTEQKIINEVANYYNLTPSQLTGKIRTGQIALARHIAMYLIRFTLDVPLKKIGNIFGGKDHTTVMNAISKVDKGLKTDNTLKEAINELQIRLKK